MSESFVQPAQMDASKRTWLIASSCAGAVGGLAVVVPFASSFKPSERAKAAGAAVEADISGLKPGEKMTVEWRGKPVWIVRRTPEQLAVLPKLDEQLADPKSARKPEEQAPAYARNATRSIKPEYMVAVMRDPPGMEGFSNTSTRRSASSAVSNAPASISSARHSSKRHTCGVNLLFGSTGTRPFSASHKGERCLGAILS